MRKSYALLWCSVMILGLIATGCKDKVKPVSERIAKAWTAESVKHDNIVVYTRGGSGNKNDYSGFRLTLTNANGTKTATLTDIDNVATTGTWDVPSDNKLVLSGLTPVPTGSGGTIEFTISSLDDAKVVLTRVKTSPKTGGTLNEYTLTNP